MDYEKKYLKYKSKYNLKKSSLLGGMGEEAIMKGGNIDAIAELVFGDVPMTSPYKKQGEHDGWTGNILHVLYPTYKLSNTQITSTSPHQYMPFSIFDRWTDYIDINTSDVGINSNIIISFKEGIVPNARPVNSDIKINGKTLLYLAAQNCNKQMFDALVAMGAGVTDINRGSHSNILHGIAWGKVNEHGHPIKTYDEKVAFMQYILQKYPETNTLLFQKNAQGESYYDNLLTRHPDKISVELKKSMSPANPLPTNPLRTGWIETVDPRTQKKFYVYTDTGKSVWKRPSLWVKRTDITPNIYVIEGTNERMTVEQFNLTYKEPI